jgi:DNA invertase Pin-like site-specific DNA recombinase
MIVDLYEIRNKIKFERLNIYDLPLRVCFYARVSTSSDAQLHSIENQITYYKEYIKNNKNWTYVNGYIDEGISGISTKNREQFHQMIRDAKLGEFDLIITKEISRFARSTLDSIKYTQELLKSGVCVYFQNDNLNTIDPDNELRLSIMSSIAQEEVRKLSERIKFGH